MAETEKTKFFIKYSDADPNRFVFRNGKVWFKINPDNEYRLLDIESDTYQRTPTWTKYLTSYKERGFGIWFADGAVQPFKKTTTPKISINLKCMLRRISILKRTYYHFPSRTHQMRITKRTPISSLSLPRTYQPIFVE